MLLLKAVLFVSGNNVMALLAMEALQMRTVKHV